MGHMVHVVSRLHGSYYSLLISSWNWETVVKAIEIVSGGTVAWSTRLSYPHPAFDLMSKLTDTDL